MYDLSHLFKLCLSLLWPRSRHILDSDWLLSVDECSEAAPLKPTSLDAAF